MAADHSSKTPSYCRQKRQLKDGTRADLAYVRLNGRRIYLGAYGSSESREEYHRLLREWEARGRRSMPEPEQITIIELADWFLTRAKGYYRNTDGSHTSEITNIRYALRALLELYPREPAAQFSQTKLKAVRQAMVNAGLTRTGINKRVGIIKRMFWWAAGDEIVPSKVAHDLRTVSDLKRGRTEAPETEPVKPVASQVVKATTAHLPPMLRDMVWIQYYTGMRPGELVAMTSGEIDTSGRVWLYHPRQHKTAHRGKSRTIPIGPRAQKLLGPYLKPDLQAPIFSPAESEQQRRQTQHEQRTTPPNRGNGPGKNRRRRPKRKPGTQYDVNAYRRAIARACDQAFPPPERLRPRELPEGGRESLADFEARLTDAERCELWQWRREHRWKPNQLRHSRATNLRKDWGLEGANVLLEHGELSTTEIYAERNADLAARIAYETG